MIYEFFLYFFAFIGLCVTALIAGAYTMFQLAKFLMRRRLAEIAAKPPVVPSSQ